MVILLVKVKEKVMYIIILLIILFVFTVFFIRFSIEINLDIKNKKISSQIVLHMYLFHKIKVLSVPIERFIKKANINYKKAYTDVEKVPKVEIRDFKFKISEFDLAMRIGTEDVILTTVLNGIASNAIWIFFVFTSTFFRKMEFCMNKIKYDVMPIYNRNMIDIKFKCIITFKFVHIISMIYRFWKRKRGNKNESKSSNRRAYAGSHE